MFPILKKLLLLLGGKKLFDPIFHSDALIVTYLVYKDIGVPGSANTHRKTYQNTGFIVITSDEGS